MTSGELVGKALSGNRSIAVLPKNVLSWAVTGRVVNTALSATATTMIVVSTRIFHLSIIVSLTKNRTQIGCVVLLSLHSRIAEYRELQICLSSASLLYSYNSDREHLYHNV